jgi:hypothetical protein
MKYVHIRYVALETVIHPETRKAIIVQGVIYTQAQFNRIARDIGVDNVNVQLFMDTDRSRVIQKACNFVNSSKGENNA